MQKIHERAVAAANNYRRAEADLIDALIAVDRSRVFSKLDYSSLFIYVTRALNLSESVAWNAIVVARKAREVPSLRDEIARGLGISKARKITPVLTSSNASFWLKKAETLSTRELEREVAAVKPKLATKERATYVTGKRLSLTLGLEESLMLRLRHAQDQVSRSLRRAASIEDTLDEIVSFYLKHKDPVERAKRVTAKKGSQGATPPVTGQVRSPEPRPVTGQDRTPIPAAIQHQVRLRDDGKCQAPACSERRWTDLHHVTPISRGGAHSASNLITLCKAHHKLVHRINPLHSTLFRAKVATPS